MDELLNSETKDDFEDSIRPRNLSDFQGKEDLKKNLSIFIQACKKRGDNLDHVFLSGPPGLGKTTLAGIIAGELGVEIKITSAPALEKAKDLVGILTSIEKNSVLFIDEIHRLKPILEEMLYIAMEDFQIDWIIGQGPGARSVRIPLQKFTLIGATTRAGNVSSPLYTRFGINLKLNLYSPKELENIISRASEYFDIKITNKAIRMLSGCCRGTPRIVNRVVKRMRDFAQIIGNNIIDEEIVSEGLLRLKIDSIGLEDQDIKLLKTIIEKYGGGPVGIDTLAISVGESISTIEDFYEPFLIQLGFIKRTPRGRVVSEIGKEYLIKNY